MNAHHELHPTIDPRNGVSDGVTCVAPPGSPCNTWCGEGCENPTEAHDSHELQPVPCMLIEWWNWDAVSALEGYTGEATELRAGPIVVESWGEDGIAWHYPEPSVSGPAVDKCDSRSPIIGPGFETCMLAMGHEGGHTGYARVWGTDLADPITVPGWSKRARTPGGSQ